MQLINSMKSGIIRSVRAWRGIILMWLFSLMLVSLVAVPLKHALKADLGSSMITEKLAHGINIEVFADLGSGFRNLGSYFVSGFLLIILIGFIFNAFLSGGIFSNLRKSASSFSTQEYFQACAKYFWPFFIISFLISLIIILLFILICLIPVSIVIQANASSEGALIKTAVVSGTIYLLLVAILLAIADYSRAWLVSSDTTQSLKALRFGFRHTFTTFPSTYSLILIILLVQFLFGWIVFSIVPVIRPAGEIGITMLFVLSQFLFIIKIYLKAWRYGSMISMMDNNLIESDRSESMCRTA
jgi:hypothetical protein